MQRLISIVQATSKKPDTNAAHIERSKLTTTSITDENAILKAKKRRKKLKVILSLLKYMLFCFNVFVVIALFSETLKSNKSSEGESCCGVDTERRTIKESRHGIRMDRRIRKR